MKIVFLGTPDFAVPSLRILVENGYDVVGVITSTDKWGGRGRKQLIESDVKQYALDQGLYIMQPPNLKNEQFLEELKGLKADLQIVVAFRMLPELVWNMPALGTYNLHGSLLPAYRGAAPINWAIINGEEITGVTTFKLQHEIDTGTIAFQEKVRILKNDSFQTVYDRMKHVGAHLVLKTVRSIEDHTIVLTEQNNELISHAPKIFHQDCRLDVNKSPYELYNYIRGLSPYPTAWTFFDDKKLKVFNAAYSYEQHRYTPGEYKVISKSELRLYVNGGFLVLRDIQWEGRKRMDSRSFINGLSPQEYSSIFQL